MTNDDADRLRLSTNEPPRRTSEMTASDAQICRDLGWQVGDLLEQIETAFPTRIELTAIGQELVLALIVASGGRIHDRPWETIVGFKRDNWRKV